MWAHAGRAQGTYGAGVSALTRGARILVGEVDAMRRDAPDAGVGGRVWKVAVLSSQMLRPRAGPSETTGGGEFAIVPLRNDPHGVCDWPAA